MAAFASASELSVWTGGKISTSDPRLPGLLDGASAAIRRYCGWHIAGPETETVLFDGPGSPMLLIPTMHLTAIASIREDGVLVDPSQYEWSVLGNVRRLRNHWPAVWSHRYRSIEVEFTHGFTSAPDVKQIVLQVCAAALSSPMGATREQAGALSVSWATTAPGVSGGLSLLARDFQVLDSYRLPGVL